MQEIRKRKVYKMTDLNEQDVINLAHVMSLDEKVFYCWGMAWNKLFKLNLIDEDTRPTRLAKMVVAEYSRRRDVVR